MAMDPTAEKPVRNLPASIHLQSNQHGYSSARLCDPAGQCTEHWSAIRALSDAGMLSCPGGRLACCAECNDSASTHAAHPLTRLLPPLYEESPPPPPKKRYGIGTITYMKAVSIGHQLCQRTHPSICSSTPREKDPARPPVPQPGPSSPHSRPQCFTGPFAELQEHVWCVIRQDA